jgi:hypothetical protein
MRGGGKDTGRREAEEGRRAGGGTDEGREGLVQRGRNGPRSVVNRFPAAHCLYDGRFVVTAPGKSETVRCAVLALRVGDASDGLLSDGSEPSRVGVAGHDEQVERVLLVDGEDLLDVEALNVVLREPVVGAGVAVGHYGGTDDRVLSELVGEVEREFEGGVGIVEVDDVEQRQDCRVDDLGAEVVRHVGLEVGDCESRGC